MVELSYKTHVLLIKNKKHVSKQNPLFKIKNDTVVKLALTKLEESEDYEIKIN
jgi:hypothetical protein